MRFILTIPDSPPMFTRLIESGSFGFYINRVLVCPQCGTGWARWTNEPTSLLEPPWQFTAEMTSCPDHAYGMWDGDLPGSLLYSNHDILVLPRELLKRELMLLMPAPEIAEEISNPSSEGVV